MVKALSLVLTLHTVHTRKKLFDLMGCFAVSAGRLWTIVLK